MENDLISRSALLRDPYFQEDRYPESHLLRMAIKEAHAVDAVEVVWCKECVCMHITETGRRYCGAWGRIQTMGDDGYCCFGERRADDGK